jgi:predicted Zn-dependent protease
LLFLMLFTVIQTQVPADPTAAISLYGRGEYARAAELFAGQCPDRQDCGETRLWLGRSYYKLHRWDDAIREISAAVQSAPSNGHYHLWLGRAYGEKAAHASIFAALSPAKKVGEEFELAQKLDPSNLEIRFDVLQFYLDAPGFIGGGMDKADAQARAIEQLNKRAGQVARARILEHDKKWADALNALTQSTLDFPRDPEVYEALADFHFKRNNFVDAEDGASRAMALRSWYPMALWIQAASRVQQGKDLGAAVDSLDRLAKGPIGEQDPTFEQIYYWLGMARLAQNKVEKAREAFLIALRHDPDYKAAQSALSKLKSE